MAQGISTQLIDQHYNYQTPATGFTITMANTDWHLILNPSGTLANGTVTMCAGPADGQLVSIRSSQIITTLTVNPNSGQSVVGAPATIGVGGTLDAIYRLTNTTWYF